jgi:hypothetical protein
MPMAISDEEYETPALSPAEELDVESPIPHQVVEKPVQFSAPAEAVVDDGPKTQTVLVDGQLIRLGFWDIPWKAKTTPSPVEMEDSYDDCYINFDPLGPTREERRAAMIAYGIPMDGRPWDSAAIAKIRRFWAKTSPGAVSDSSSESDSEYHDASSFLDTEKSQETPEVTEKPEETLQVTKLESIVDHQIEQIPEVPELVEEVTDNAVHDELPCTPVHGLSPKLAIVSQDDCDLDDDEFSLQRNENTAEGHKEAVAFVKEPLRVLQKKRQPVSYVAVPEHLFKKPQAVSKSQEAVEQTEESKDIKAPEPEPKLVMVDDDLEKWVVHHESFDSDLDSGSSPASINGGSSAVKENIVCFPEGKVENNLVTEVNPLMTEEYVVSEVLPADTPIVLKDAALIPDDEAKEEASGQHHVVTEVEELTASSIDKQIEDSQGAAVDEVHAATEEKKPITGSVVSSDGEHIEHPNAATLEEVHLETKEHKPMPGPVISLDGRYIEDPHAEGEGLKEGAGFLDTVRGLLAKSSPTHSGTSSRRNSQTSFGSGVSLEEFIGEKLRRSSMESSGFGQVPYAAQAHHNHQQLPERFSPPGFGYQQDSYGNRSIHHSSPHGSPGVDFSHPQQHLTQYPQYAQGPQIPQYTQGPQVPQYFQVPQYPQVPQHHIQAPPHNYQGQQAMGFFPHQQPVFTIQPQSYSPGSYCHSLNFLPNYAPPLGEDYYCGSRTLPEHKGTAYHPEPAQVSKHGYYGSAEISAELDEVVKVKEVPISSLEFQCSTCGKHLTHDNSVICLLCGVNSTTRFCDERCRYAGAMHWLSCGTRPLPFKTDYEPGCMYWGPLRTFAEANPWRYWQATMLFDYPGFDYLLFTRGFEDNKTPVIKKAIVFKDQILRNRFYSVLKLAHWNQDVLSIRMVWRTVCAWIEEQGWEINRATLEEQFTKEFGNEWNGGNYSLIPETMPTDEEWIHTMNYHGKLLRDEMYNGPFLHRLPALKLPPVGEEPPIPFYITERMKPKAAESLGV